MHLKRSAQRRGKLLATTLVETMVALAICAVICTSLAVMQGQVLQWVKANQQASSASLVLQERTERMRIANWRQMTDAAYLSNSFLGSAPASASPLGNFTETITVTTYPNRSEIDPLVVQRSSDGTRVLQQSPNMLAQNAARFDFKIEFTDLAGNPKVRETTTVLSKSGVSLINLDTSGVGTIRLATETVPDSDTPTTPTPTPENEDSPTPTPTPLPETDGNGNGNGNGKGNSRGTVGGKGGMK